MVGIGSRAFYIRFKNITSKTYMNNYVFPNFSNILDMSRIERICVREDSKGQDSMVIYLNDLKIMEFINFCNEKNIIDVQKDITNELLLNINLDEVVKMMIVSDEYEHIFNSFFEENLTIDTVLDKINLHGLKHLKSYDKKILRSEA